MSPMIPAWELRCSSCIVQPTPSKVVKATPGANFDKIGLLKIYLDKFLTCSSQIKAVVTVGRDIYACYSAFKKNKYTLKKYKDFPWSFFKPEVFP